MTDLDKWIDVVKECKYLPENDLKKLCEIVSALLLEESNIQPVSTPVTVCGDIHGQVTYLCFRLETISNSHTWLLLYFVVLRFGGAVSLWRSGARHELYFHGRFRRSGLLQSRNANETVDVKSALARQNNLTTGQPREQANNASLRVLRRMPQQIR